MLRQATRKPGSVLANHLSSSIITHRIKRVLLLYFGGYLLKHSILATDRVYHFHTSPHGIVGFYPTRFTFSHLWVVSFLWHFP